MLSDVDLSNVIGTIQKAILLPQKELLTIDDVCMYTGFSKSYVYKLTSANEIPFYKPNGKSIFFKRSEIDTWVFRNKIRSHDELEQIADERMKHRKKH